MSTNLDMLAERSAAASDVTAPLGQRVLDTVGQWLKSAGAGVRQTIALRRSLQEISRLSERELLDIGLDHDEIVRLRSSECFMPRSWQAPQVKRDELPF